MPRLGLGVGASSVSKSAEICKMFYAGASRARIAKEVGTSTSYVRAIISRERDRGAREKGEHRMYGPARENSMKMNPTVPTHWQKAAALKRAGFSDWEVQQALPSGGF